MLRGSGGTGYVAKGGTYYTRETTEHLANSSVITPAFRHLHFGVRICADVP